MEYFFFLFLEVKIKYYTHYSLFWNCQPQFLSITFAVQYFNQKAPNNTTISHLFTGKKLFFYKTLHPWKIRGCPIKPNPPLTKKSRVMWIVPNSVIYMTTSTFKNKYEELKNASYGPFSTKNSTSLSGSKDMLVWIV